MFLSADQFNSASPASLSRTASSVSQSDTNPTLTSGLGTAIPLEQVSRRCAGTGVDVGDGVGDGVGCDSSSDVGTDTNSAEFVGYLSSSCVMPPTRKTRPSGSRVAVWLARGIDKSGPGNQELDAGS